MPDSNDTFYARYARFYAQSLARIADVCTTLGDTSTMEPMERGAVCKAALTRIAFIAESTPTTADLALRSEVDKHP